VYCVQECGTEDVARAGWRSTGIAGDAGACVRSCKRCGAAVVQQEVQRRSMLVSAVA